MTKTRLIFAAATALLGASLIFSQAYAQGRPSATGDAGKTSITGDKVGLIDMEEVFKNYKKFNILKDELRADMEKSKDELEVFYKQLQALEKQLKDSTFKKDSDNYIQLESRFTKDKAAFEAEVQNKDREFKRRQAEIYKTIHAEVQDIVEVFAKKKGYALVMRFRRPKAVDSDPRSIAMDLQSSVIYHRDGDDITDVITSALNYYFEEHAGTNAPKRDTKIRQTNGTAKPRTTPPATRNRTNK